ncbi:MAG: SLBB domain-containing protein, partial [Gammaproteobacteria bacterium]
DEVTLEEKIQKQRIQDELSQYGYDFFSSIPSTFVPVTNLHIPSDYHVGPGDMIIVQLYGKKNVEYRLVVQRDGRLLIPEFGPLEVTGMTFGEVKESLKQQFSQSIIGISTVISMAELRTIHVILAGEAVKPGRYTVSGLSTLFNALLNSGGVKRTGSLRNIQLKRTDKTVTTFDLYDVLQRGDSSKDVRLEHNDIIFIPTIGPTVGVGGEVQRPAIYELKNEKTVGELIAMAGGVLPTASIQDSHIERITQDSYRTLVDLHGAKTDDPRQLLTPILNGDVVRILPVMDTMRDVVLLSGHVKRPGGYQFKQGKRISDLLSHVDDLLPNADFDFALLRREVPDTKRIMVIFVELGRILTDRHSSANIELKNRDELIIFERSQPRGPLVTSLVDQMERQSREGELPMVFDFLGHTRHKGRFPLQKYTRLNLALKAAGGLLPGADRDYILIVRTNPETNRLSMFSVRYDKSILSDRELHNPFIHPYDRIYVFGEDNNRSQLISNDLDQMIMETDYSELSPAVFVNGPVHQPGRYPLEPGMRPSDLVRAAGGLKEKAYGYVAELTRFTVNGDQYQEFRREKLELSEVLSGYNQLELMAYDHLTILPKPGWSEQLRVEVSGEVKFPGSYIVQNGETLCSLIERFGAFRSGAYTYGAIFTRENVRIKQQVSLDRLKEQMEEMLVTLQLSPSKLNDEKMPVRDANYDVIKVIKQLKDKKASGRMVIDLQNAVECDSHADIALEDGDKLHVPMYSDEVSVAGQVYFPTSHQVQTGKKSRYYIELSGGNTVLGKLKHAYVVQANGEVDSMRPSSFLGRAKNIDVSAGAMIYVPLNVDRINGYEKFESWTKTLFQLALVAGVIL